VERGGEERKEILVKMHARPNVQDARGVEERKDRGAQDVRRKKKKKQDKS
jgi:hypothetical protein